MFKVVGGLFALLGWVVLVGLQRMWRGTFGWLFNTLAGLLDAVHIPIPHFHDPRPFGGVAKWLRSLDRNVSSQLALRADQLEHLAVALFSRLHVMFSWIGREIEGLAGDVLGFGLRLVRATIPRLVKSLLRFVWRELRALGRYARKQIPKLTHRLFAFAKWATHAIARGVKHLGFLWKWAKAVVKLHWRVLRGLVKRARALERRLLPKPFQGLVMGALTGLGVAWVIGRNIVALANWINKLSHGDIYEFVGGAFTIATTTDLCKLAAYQFDLAVFIFDPVMQQILGLSKWVCFHSDDELPSATKGTGGYAKAWAPSATPAITGPYLPERLAPDIPLPAGVISA